MKQIVIRTIDLKIPVLYVMAGTISEGEPFQQFPEDEMETFISERLGLVSDLVRFDDLFGGIPYLRVSDITPVLRTLIHGCDRVEYYPNFLVFTFID